VLRNRGRWAWRHWCTGQRGQGLVEYALILLLAVLAVIGGLALLGPTLANIFSNVRPAL
jgi:pilus assembly protein Flp/PilA